MYYLNYLFPAGKPLLVQKGIAFIYIAFALTAGWGCQNSHQPAAAGSSSLVRLITLDPGHFHAALVQKEMYEQIATSVHVYAPDGLELKAHLSLIEKYNNRAEHPTAWKEIVYTGPDYLEKMLQEKPGSIVVISGNNRKKTEYIKTAINAGMNVLADKPMAVTIADFNVLKDAFIAAGEKNVLLYDIMTSRYEITNIIQKALAGLPGVFGQLEKGTAENPAVTILRTHYFLKYVSGAPLIRPVWYFDVAQEGYGIVDVTTHLVDLVQWECFPNTSLDYKKDIDVFAARQWPTAITPAAFRQITKSDTFPAFLDKDVKNNILNVYANGEMNYTIKGIHARITMIWDVEPEKGAGDSHYSCLRGTKSNLVIRQGKDQHYKPVLYIENVKGKSTEMTTQALTDNMKEIIAAYPGISLKKVSNGWQVLIPDQYAKGHEQHFASVTEKYLQYLREGKLPDGEIANMIAKYYTTTQALEKATAR